MQQPLGARGGPDGQRQTWSLDSSCPREEGRESGRREGVNFHALRNSMLKDTSKRRELRDGGAEGGLPEGAQGPHHNPGCKVASEFWQRDKLERLLKGPG